MNDRLVSLLLAAAASAAPLLAGPPPPPAEARPLTVREAVRLALERAPEIALAESTSALDAAAAEESHSVRNPQLYLNTTPGYSVGLPLAVAGEVPAAFGAAARLTVYDPALRSEELQARAQSAVSGAALAEVRLDVARRTVAAFAKLFADTTREAGARERLEAREAIARQQRALLREGRVTELDADRAALDEARARQKLDAVRSDLDLDRHELARLVGFAPTSLVAPAEDPGQAVPAAGPGDSVAAALATDARSKALAEESEALGRSAKLLAQVFKPSVNAEARYAFVPRGFGYDKYYLSYQENVASIGVSIVVPVLTGGRDSARAAQARARLSRVEAERRIREADLSQDVRAAEAAAERSRLEAGLARRGAALAEEGLRQARALEREGRGETDGVPRAQLALVDARDEAALLARDEMAARLRLLALRGELLMALGAGEETTSGKR